MFDLVEKLPDRDFYCEAVLKALPEDPDSWDAVHRFWLACNFAELGYKRAKEAMYAAYRPGPHFGDNIGDSFTAMDGLHGFLFAADKIGESLLVSDHEVETGYLVGCADDRLGEEVTWGALRARAEQNPRIKALIDAVETSRISDPDRDKILDLPYDELKPHIGLRRSRTRLAEWGEQASESELQLAALGLIASTDPAELGAHLRIFSRTPFPLDPTPLFLMVDGVDQYVANGALYALEQLELPAARTLAFRLMEERSSLRGEAIGLLRSSFEPGDHELALKWFSSESDPEVLHSFQTSIRRLWEDHPQSESEVAMLLRLYERGPCSFLRVPIVNSLLERNALPDHLREECMWDANYEVRNLVRPPEPTPQK